MIEKLYTVEEVAELASVTGRTIRNYLKSGKLIGRKIGGQWRFPESEVQRLLTGGDPEPMADEPAGETYADPYYEEPQVETPDYEPAPQVAPAAAIVPEAYAQPPAAAPAPAAVPQQAPVQPAPQEVDWRAEAPPVASQPTHHPVYSPAPAAQPIAAPMQTAPSSPVYQPPLQAPAAAPVQQVPVQPFTQTVPLAQPQYNQPQPRQHLQYNTPAPLPNSAPPSPARGASGPDVYADAYYPAQDVPASWEQPLPEPVYAPHEVHSERPLAQPPQQRPNPVTEIQAQPQQPVAARAEATPKEPLKEPEPPRPEPVEAKPEEPVAETPQDMAEPALSEIGMKVLQFVAEVHDCSEGPQACTVLETRQNLETAKTCINQLIGMAKEESIGNIHCEAYVEYDDRFAIARYTLIGSSAFLARCLQYVG